MPKSLFALIALATMNTSAAQAVTVFGNTSAAQVIGVIAAGQAYNVSAIGTVALCGSCNGGGPLSFNPDGTVATPAQGGYAAFNSGSKDYDPSVSTSAYGIYGAGIFFGALYGSFTATPTTASDLFLIGYGTTIAAGATRTLYGVVNDSHYSDNTLSSFNVTLAQAQSSGAVPEPATWAMTIVGFAMLGGAMRRRDRINVRFT